MALRLRRGTNAERLTITPVESELIYTTDTKELFVGDGFEIGGNKIGGIIPQIINDLTDVDAATPDIGQILKWNGANWVASDDDNTGVVEGLEYRISIVGNDESVIVNSETNTVTGTFVGDGSQLTNLPIAADGSGVVEGSNYRINIVGDDSSTIVNTATNTITGTFIGDGSQLTNLPSSVGTSIFDLSDVSQFDQLEADDLLVWDGFNFINQQIGDLINLDEISLLNVSIIGDDSSIIVDALTNRVYAFELDTDQVNTTNIHTLKRAGSDGTATHNIEGLEGNAALTLTAHRTGVAAGSGYSNSILLGATGSDGAKNTTALYAAENILYLTQDSTGALNIEAKYITYDSTSGIGKLGIGTFNPSEVLDVVGNVKVSGSIQPGVFVDVLARDTAITSPTNGMMIYLTATHKFQGYANGVWVDLN